jgi:fused signal recognition particle receptor
MSTVVIVVVALVLAAVVVMLLLRPKGGAQLQGSAPSAPLPPGPEKAKAKSQPPKEKEADKKEKAEATPKAPSKPPPSKNEPAAAPAPATELPSGEVLTAESAPAQPIAPPSAPPPPRKKDVAGLRRGLSASRGGFIARLTELFQGKKEIDPAILDRIEEVMLSSDVGPKTTAAILARLRESLDRNELRDGDAVWAALRAEATRILGIGGGALRFATKPTVVLLVGVNGVGKTTTIGKLATKYTTAGKKVILGAGDTFRAAAVQQLEVWGRRVGATVIKGKDGTDPASVAFDAANAAREASADLLMIDTAGRLHTKVPLMDEIKKVRKTIAKAMEGAPHETLLVLDATTGQNALTQAALFKDAVDLTGIVLTKLDGTAKGGIVLGICDELKVPVRYIGLGERAEDLREFHAEEFVEALFGKGEEEVAAA